MSNVEKIILDLIRTPEAWEVLKRLIDEQKENNTMPADIREVFFTADAERLSELTLAENAVIAAVASTRLSYDGKVLGASGVAGTISVVPTPAAEG